MNAFGPYFSNSELDYVRMRNRRAREGWAVDGRHGLQGYAAFLMGADPGVESGALVGAESAAYTSQGSSVFRAVAIGVATGALTFLINRWLGKVFK